MENNVILSYHCSFCGTPPSKAKVIIAGPRNTNICDECIAVCNDIIAEYRAKVESTTVDAPELGGDK